MSNRSGKVSIGGVILLILVAGAAYYAYALGGVYWRRYRLRDAVDERLSYLGELTPESIQQQLQEKIAKMHLPPAARRVHIVQSGPRTIQLTIHYTEKVNLLFTTKDIPMSIEERRTY